jgi:hypothetical protein
MVFGMTTGAVAFTCQCGFVIIEPDSRFSQWKVSCELHLGPVGNCDLQPQAVWVSRKPVTYMILLSGSAGSQ